MTDEAMARGAAIGSRAILSAILVEIGSLHGEEAVRRIRVRADVHVNEATHRMNRECSSLSDLDEARESASIAEGFLDDAFAAAYSAG